MNVGNRRVAIELRLNKRARGVARWLLSVRCDRTYLLFMANEEVGTRHEPAIPAIPPALQGSEVCSHGGKPEIELPK